MNITHVVENLNRGGLERVVLDLVRLQQQQGHRCQVVCLFERGSLATELDEVGIPVYACGKRKGLDVRALLRMRRIIRTHGTHVLHTHNAVAHYQSVLAVCGLRATRIINTRHGMGGLNRWHRAELAYRLALLPTDVIATVCEAARDGAIDKSLLPRRKVRVVPNGIRVESFAVTSPAMRAQLRQRFGLSPQARIVGSVGRLTWAKDQSSLIRAFRIVGEQLPEAALLLIGEGELRERLEQCAAAEGVADRVHFLGDRSDVRELLQGLDVFAMSSLSEGYSMALLEASATALPIIATDVGGNREIVHDGLTGRIVPASDPQAMAAALGELLREPQRAAELGHAARASVESSGSVEAMAARYMSLYSKGPG